MTNITIVILLIITALPLSQATENHFTGKVVNSTLGRKLKIEPKEENAEEKGGKENFKLSPLPYKKEGVTDFVPWSKASKSIDLATNKTLFEKNPNEKLQIASLTKLMTAIVAVENIKTDGIVTVPTLKNMPGESTMGLTAGEKIKAGELFHGVLIHSAGDAAYTLAVHISGTEEKFVELMNQRAKEMMLTNSHFSNASGYIGTDNYSTVNDLINLTRLFLNNDELKKIVAMQKYQAKNEAGKTYNLKTTNQLLDNQKIFGVKTGYTPQAGECLITLAKENDHEILTVVLGSTSRFAETTNLINWVSTNFMW